MSYDSFSEFLFLILSFSQCGIGIGLHFVHSLMLFIGLRWKFNLPSFHKNESWICHPENQVK